MTRITEQDLILLYYGEHDDPELARAVAESPRWSARFNALGEALAAADQYTAPERPKDYGDRVWRQIAPRLQVASRPSAGSRSRLSRLINAPLGMAVSLLLVAGLAFWVGNRIGGSGQSPPSLIATEPGRLLQVRVSRHLNDADRLLTRLSNDVADGESETDLAADMLLTNRLYRRAAEAAGHRRLAGLLGELETLLLELANEGWSSGATAANSARALDSESLLFKVRVTQRKLERPGRLAEPDYRL